MNKTMVIGVLLYLIGVVLLLASFQYGTLLPGVIVSVVGTLLVSRGLKIRQS